MRRIGDIETRWQSKSWGSVARFIVHLSYLDFWLSEFYLFSTCVSISSLSYLFFLIFKKKINTQLLGKNYGRSLSHVHMHTHTHRQLIMLCDLYECGYLHTHIYPAALALAEDKVAEVRNTATQLVSCTLLSGETAIVAFNQRESCNSEECIQGHAVRFCTHF